MIISSLVSAVFTPSPSEFMSLCFSSQLSSLISCYVCVPCHLFTFVPVWIILLNCVGTLFVFICLSTHTRYIRSFSSSSELKFCANWYGLQLQNQKIFFFFFILVCMVAEIWAKCKSTLPTMVWLVCVCMCTWVVRGSWDHPAAKFVSETLICEHHVHSSGQRTTSPPTEPAFSQGFFFFLHFCHQ